MPLWGQRKEDPHSMRRSFASRVGYVGFAPGDSTVSDIERQYLLGGTGQKRSFAANSASAASSSAARLPGKRSALVADDLVSKELPFADEGAKMILQRANLLTLACSGALMYFCATEGRSTTEETSPVLIFGMFLNSVVIINALVGFMGLYRANTDTDMTSTKNLLQMHHAIALSCTVLMVLLGVWTLVHWDIGGEVAHQLFHRPETIGVQHRWAIWSLTLAVAFSLVLVMFGSLSMLWPNDDIFKWTLYASSTFTLLVGGSMIGVGAYMFKQGEIATLETPWSVIGSIVAGGVLALVSLYGMSAASPSALSKFAKSLLLASLLVITFSISNAMAAEPELKAGRKSTLLFSALIGIWGQIVAVTAGVAAIRWRSYLVTENL